MNSLTFPKNKATNKTNLQMNIHDTSARCRKIVGSRKGYSDGQLCIISMRVTPLVSGGIHEASRDGALYTRTSLFLAFHNRKLKISSLAK